MNVELIVWIIIAIGLWELFYWKCFRGEFDNYFESKLVSGVFGTGITALLFTFSMLIRKLFEELFKDVIFEPRYFIIPGIIVGVFVINYLIEIWIKKGCTRKIKMWRWIKKWEDTKRTRRLNTVINQQTYSPKA